MCVPLLPTPTRKPPARWLVTSDTRILSRSPLQPQRAFLIAGMPDCVDACLFDCLWLWRFPTGRSAGVLACPVNMRLAVKRRRHRTDGGSAKRVVKKAGLVLVPASVSVAVCGLLQRTACVRSVDFVPGAGGAGAALAHD